ncbi:MAG: efflux RND transporter periplasmic adaptor subunit [Bryobacterales bacterium]|nr:efflux RND transporter periplasmic adaptor subunit [Bryobacterales bacterium]
MWSMILAMRKLSVTIAFVLLAGTGCNRGGSQQTASAAGPAGAVAPQAKSNPMEIEVTETLMQRLKLGEPSYSQIGASISVAARLEVDETRVARVGSPVMGRIIELDVLEGQQVTAGQLLAVVNSTGLSGAQLAYMKALSQEQLAERAVGRAQQLLDAGVIGSAELRRREAELSQATAEVTGTRDELVVLGLSDEAIARVRDTRTIDSKARVLASRSGTVVQRRVTVGQVIQSADTLAEIADLSSLWLVADVPEQAAGSLVAGQTVEAEIAAMPGHVIHGKISFVSAIVNAETRTIRARMDLPNPNQKYKPSMLATMALKDPTQMKQVVPVTAVVREGNTEHVFVQVGPSRFLLRPVTLGEQFGNQRVVIDGIRSGERIVTDGAFHLNNERVRLAIQGA